MITVITAKINIFVKQIYTALIPFDFQECGLLLSSEEEGHGCYPIEGHLLCQPCNGKRVKELTRKSGSTQHPLTTEL